MDILKEYSSPQIGGIMHCFAGDETMAKQVMELGFYIAFNGIITFNSAGQLREVLSTVPLDKIVIETDCPFLAPVPHRGKTNEPAFVTEVVKKIADIKDITPKQVAEATTKNAQEILSLTG